ncbi:MAG: TetR/AcrR family transcriptional regulator [Acidimicrobiales bacterium]
MATARQVPGKRSGIRMTSEERREAVLAAAQAEFARKGLTGTSTEDIAARAGISQPYLFRLFPTKRALFEATVQRTFRRVEDRFRQAAEGLTGDDALHAMALAYGDLLADRDLLACQLHTYAAGGDPEVGPVARSCFRELWELVAALGKVPADEVRDFFAKGMLLNVLAALDLASLDPEFAAKCIPAVVPSTAAAEA